MARDQSSRTGDPDDAPPFIRDTRTVPTCLRCHEPVPGAKELHTLCPRCDTAERAKHEELLARIKAGEMPVKRDYRINPDAELSAAERETLRKDYDTILHTEWAQMGDRNWLARYRLGLPVPEWERRKFEAQGFKVGQF
jgi:hypothetical protein